MLGFSSWGLMGFQLRYCRRPAAEGHKAEQGLGFRVMHISAWQNAWAGSLHSY